jgi:HEAT repeat protein
MNTASERLSSALIILGNPIGTYPVSSGDLPELLEYTKDENPAVRHMSLYQMQQLKTTSFYDDILPLLLDDDLSVSRITEELLLKNETSALPVLRDALGSENNQLKIKVLELLIKLDDRESLPLVLELFKSPDLSVVQKAVDTASMLADLNDRILFDTLLRSESSMRAGVVKTFNKIGDPSILGTLLPYFYDPDVKVQNAVKFTFVDFGDESIPYLLNVLKNPVPKTQIAVLGLLEALQNQDSITHIIPLFANGNERVKAAAINTVFTFKKKALLPLTEFLENENEEIVINCVKLLGQIKSDEIVSSLIPLLNHQNGKIREAVFDSVLKHSETAGDQFLNIIDTGKVDFYESAVRGLLLLRDVRLIVDNDASLNKKNNRGKALISNVSLVELDRYLGDVDVSGLIVRDFSLIKKMSLAASLLISSEREIRESGSKYTTFYISRNDFLNKSEEALKLSFSFMHDYMRSKNPEDLETARKQQEFSNMFKEAAEGLDGQLENYIGSTEEEKNLIKSFESSREDIITFYESVSLNRKNLADEVLSFYRLSYQQIQSGNLFGY